MDGGRGGRWMVGEEVRDLGPKTCKAKVFEEP
jgi:hypothetical protein